MKNEKGKIYSLSIARAIKTRREELRLKILSDKNYFPLRFANDNSRCPSGIYPANANRQ